MRHLIIIALSLLSGCLAGCGNTLPELADDAKLIEFKWSEPGIHWSPDQPLGVSDDFVQRLKVEKRWD